ncbi:MAG: hypothetical protein E6J91_52430 [Deltaproteobacteria bacterium]|nr:MAG: hypothetical protein E6J91_52430 [Deltaproteobacteria bacterium]
MAGEPQIEQGEPARGVVVDGEAAARGEAERPGRHADALEQAAAGERDDDEVAALDVLDDERQRAALEHDAAAGDPEAEREGRRLAAGQRHAQAGVVREPPAGHGDGIVDARRRDREGAEVIGEHHRLARGPQRGGRADRGRDQHGLGAGGQGVLVDPAAIAGDPDQRAGAGRDPDLVGERGDGLDVGQRDPLVPRIGQADERDGVGIGDDEGLAVAGELEVRGMDHGCHDCTAGFEHYW